MRAAQMLQMDLPLWANGSLHHVLSEYLTTECDHVADATRRDYLERACWLLAVLGETTGPRGEGLLHVTLRKRLVLLRAALVHAHAMGWCDRPPPMLPKLPLDGVRRQSLLTSEQWPRLEAQVCPGAMRRCVQLLWHTGMHTADVFLATTSDFEPDYQWRRENGETFALGRWLRRNTKSHATPTWMPMHGQFRETARAWLAEVPAGRQVCGRLWNVRRSIHAACTRAELPLVSPIDLRRSCASLLLGLGCSDEYVRHYLGQTSPVGRDGHASARATVLTQHYARPTPELYAAAAAAAP
jgi:integrase